MRVIVYPYWDKNPYLNLLYLAARSRGDQVVEVASLPGLIDALKALRGGDVVHLHWTTPIAQHSSSHADATRRADRLRSALERAQARGARLLWTVHNVLPHETPHLDVELALRRFLAAACDRIVVLNPTTVDAVSEHYSLPAERVVVIPHCSYWGVYPDEVSTRLARELLELPVAAHVVGHVGQLRPYKGLPLLFQAIELLRGRHDEVALAFAGETSPEDVSAIESMIPSGLPTVRRYDFVPDAQLQLWYSASDVMVFPYERVLNSGSMFLAATFGRACVVPRTPALQQEFRDQPWVHLYDATAESDRATQLAAALDEAMSTAAQTREAAYEFARGRLPWTMSSRYADLLDQLPTR